MSIFYVYAYYESKSNLPFYIGKGHNDRAYVHLARCHWPSSPNKLPLFYNKLRKMAKNNMQPEIVIIQDCLTENDAFELEHKLIQQVGRRDLKTGPLCNLTDGGEGSAGHITSGETRRKLSKANRGHSVSSENIQKLILRNKSREFSVETRVKMSKAQCGRICSEETKQKMRESRKRFRRPINAYNENNQCVEQFESISSVKDKGYHVDGVRRCLYGKRKTHKGLIWRYANA